MDKNKIKGVVFSSDKASQLKLFLDSINKNASEVFNINVIISYTEDDYRKAYELIVTDYAYAGVNFFYAKDDFKSQVLELMKDGGDYSCFFLDDDIIYKEISFADIVEPIEADDDVVCFSLRLGENTTKCYTLGADNVMHDMIKSGNTMKWDWTLHYLDFGYPFSMNGHIFRKNDIYKLVKKSTFSNVEELEMALYDYTEMFPRNMMVSYRDSRLVNIPCGRVQQSIDDEMTSAIKECEARLRRKSMNAVFLSGESLSLENIDLSNVEGCHQKFNLGKSFDQAIKDSESHPMDRIAIKFYGRRWEELTEAEQKEINDSIERIQL